MHPALAPHEPLLVNTIGHSTGTLIFGLSLFFLLRHRDADRLSIAAAALAFGYNLSSLLVLGFPSEPLVAVSTSALSVLPAVLLHVSLRDRFGWIVRAGYGLSGIAVVLHATEHLSTVSHRSALLLTTVGFGALTIATAGMLLRERERLSRVIAAMALFLFSATIMHLGAGEPQTHWPFELAAHHAGVALALVVLLQDYRFLLLDAYIRVLASLLLAAAFIAAAEQIRASMAHGPFEQGLYIVGGAALLVLYGVLRGALQRLLTRVLFGRPGIEAPLANLREIAARSPNEADFLPRAASEVAAYLNAPVQPADPEASIPVKFASGGAYAIALGPRRGGRRYLSEDLEAAHRLAAEIAEHVERFRQAEMSRLVAQAELRALESQIHPHFLFNALNTLYGVIPREAAGARRTVLNLADILRYSLKQDKTFIALDEELRVVEAYLEIEKLRLGGRLAVEILVAPEARAVPIPVLSLQSLVENAVKHAIAARPQGGKLTISAAVRNGQVAIRVSDTGPGFDTVQDSSGHGVGLENVSRRLRLCYGEGAELRISSSPDGSTVGFEVPWPGVSA